MNWIERKKRCFLLGSAALPHRRMQWHCNVAMMRMWTIAELERAEFTANILPRHNLGIKAFTFSFSNHKIHTLNMRILPHIPLINKREIFSMFCFLWIIFLLQFRGCTVKISIFICHPFSILLIPSRSQSGRGQSQLILDERCGGTSWTGHQCVAGPSYTDKHLFILTSTPTCNLKWTILQSACLWTERGSQSTWRQPVHGQS